MKGDFSRISFDPKNHFSRVLLQQGRVTLDADPNESAAILLHYLRTLARDLIGPCGGPADALGFQLEISKADDGSPVLKISPGRYYVDGVLVENDSELDYATQPFLEPVADDPVFRRLKNQLAEDVWLYLDVWERHVTWIENDRIRESALGGPDTCTRSQVVWQVRGVVLDDWKAAITARRGQLDDLLLSPQGKLDPEQVTAFTELRDELEKALDGAEDKCHAPLVGLVGLSHAWMRAQLDPGKQPKDPCVIAPGASYRGAENQLYRVEVHRGSGPGGPTFKWSRDNGSVAARWLGTDGDDLIVSHSRGFEPGVWVELSDETHEQSGRPGLLVKLVKVQGDRLTIDPESLPENTNAALSKDAVNAKVRRWDQAENDDVTLVDGAVPLREVSGTTDSQWLDLEDGIQIQFAAAGIYRSGDYWLIPARVATGDIEWPERPTAGEGKVAVFQRPHGVAHHFASLGFLIDGDAGAVKVGTCTCTIAPLGDCDADAAPRPGPRPVKPVRPVKPGRGEKPKP
jgi:hypothetical protein